MCINVHILAVGVARGYSGVAGGDDLRHKKIVQADGISSSALLACGCATNWSQGTAGHSVS